jgi:hypothetical protein
MRGSIPDDPAWYDAQSSYIQNVISYLSNGRIQKRFDFYSPDFFYNFDITKNNVVKKTVGKKKAKDDNSLNEDEDSLSKPWKFFMKDKFSSGNNHTLWDYTHVEELICQQKIMAILRYNMLSPGHQNNKVSTDKCITNWGRDIPPQDLKGLKMMCFSPYRKNVAITYLKGCNIGETVWLNLLPEDFIKSNGTGNDKFDVGFPIWEKKPLSIDDKESIKNLQTTYLGNSAPLYMLVNYNAVDPFVTYSPMIVYYDTPEIASFYPNRTLYLKGKEYRILRLDEDKNLLRDFPIILSQGSPDESQPYSVYNTPVVRNIQILTDPGLDHDMSSIKIVCGGIYDNSTSAVCMAKGEVSYEVPFDISHHHQTNEFVDLYNRCLNPMEFLYAKNVCTIIESCKDKFKFFRIRWNKNLNKASSDVVMIDKIISVLWDHVCNGYYRIIDMCNCHVEYNEEEWKKKVMDWWSKSVECVVSNNHRAKKVALLYVGKSIINNVQISENKSKKKGKKRETKTVKNKKVKSEQANLERVAQ